MKILTAAILIILVMIDISAQDKRYTHNSENGYMWLDFEKRMIVKNVKYDFLSTMLQNEKLKKLSGNYKDELGCENEISILQSYNTHIELNEVISMIDEFYRNEINLVIPIRYTYCYCIKKLAGIDLRNLESYKLKLIEFSNSELKK